MGESSLECNLSEREEEEKEADGLYLIWFE